MSPLVLLGGGGHASDVLAVIEALAAQGAAPGPIYVADDHWRRPERFEGRSVEVQLVESIAAGAGRAPFLAAVGFPKSRQRVHDLAVAVGGRSAPALVHPSTSVATTARMGAGVVVMGQAWLSPGVDLGTHCHIGYGASVGHDTVLGAFCSVMPGAQIGGEVELGDGVLVEAGAIVLRSVVVGDGAVIGPGAVVLDDVAPGATVTAAS